VTDATIRLERTSKQDTNQGKTLIQMHINKTGGTTLSSILSRNFPKDATYNMDPLKDPYCVDKFRHLPEHRKDKIRHLSSHGIWGLDKDLSQPSTYITFLRDPVDRVISEYYYIISRPDHPLCGELRSKKVSLEDYVRNGMHLAWNCQTRHLRGLKRGSPPSTGPMHLSTNDLEIAKANLREYFTFGLTEKFDESLVLLKRTLGWRIRHIRYFKLNVRRNRLLKDNISRELVNLIESHNQLDMELYEFAKQLIEKWISQQGPSFKRELQIFRIYNRFYGLYGLIRNTKQASLLIGLVKLLLALGRGEVQFSYAHNKFMGRLKRTLGK